MIIAHYINPYFQENSAEFDLLILEDSTILTRSVSKFQLPLDNILLLDNAYAILSDYCDEYNSELPAEDHINLGVDELIYDLPADRIDE